VLVFGRVHVAAELVRSEPSLVSKPTLAELFDVLLDFARGMEARKIAENYERKK
jgi:hypothetical protein